jgi:hypothetical protein
MFLKLLASFLKKLLMDALNAFPPPLAISWRIHCWQWAVISLRRAFCVSKTDQWFWPHHQATRDPTARRTVRRHWLARGYAPL